MPEFDWDALETIVPRRDAKPPGPAFTVYEFAAKRSVSRNSAKSILNHSIDDGLLKSGLYWSAERGKWLTYYWLPEAKK